MAPELSLGKSTFSEQTDIYALGLVLYRLLNNDLLPFMSAENINNQEYAELAIVRRNSGERIPAPANGNPALNSVILKSVEFLPENRYKSAEEFKKALMNYGSGNTVTPNYTPLDATERANAVSYSGINQTPFAHYEQPVFNSPNYTTPSYHSQNIYPSSVPTAQEQATEKTKTMNLTIICATVCILAAIIAIVLILNKDNTTESNNNADSSISSSESVSTASNYNTTSMSCLETAEEQKNASADNDVEPDPSNIIPVKKVSCSSHAGNGKYGRKYGADMAIDGKPQTCWMAYGTPAGKGNWIKLDFGKKTTITGIKLINGNTWNGVYKGSFIDGYDKLYEKNGRLHAFTAEISDGWTFTGIAYDVNETEYETNIFYFDTPVETSYIKLYVVSGYKGYKYKNNVCIGEIQAFC